MDSGVLVYCSAKAAEMVHNIADVDHRLRKLGEGSSYVIVIVETSFVTSRHTWMIVKPRWIIHCHTCIQEEWLGCFTIVIKTIAYLPNLGTAGGNETCARETSHLVRKARDILSYNARAIIPAFIYIPPDSAVARMRFLTSCEVVRTPPNDYVGIDWFCARVQRLNGIRHFSRAEIGKEAKRREIAAA